jgi:hypothetical protein
MTHRLDAFDWCERCGESALRILDMRLECEVPPPDVLARRRVASVVARAPLMRAVDRVMARLEDEGMIP